VKRSSIVNAVVFVALLMLCSCTQYPMGLSKEQWQGLSPAQQAEYQAKQYQIDEEQRRQEGKANGYNPPTGYYTTESYHFSLRNGEYSRQKDYDRHDNDGHRGAWGSENQPVDDWKQH